ncbi:MAG: alpha/beta hydrolase-fold protein, partial [Planctomycetota bacterium]
MESTYEENVFEFRHLTKYRVIAPPGADRRTPRPIFLALHGMGMNVPKFQRILRHLEVSEMLLVIPEGMYPYEMRQKEEIEVGYGWYIYRGDQDEFYEHLETSEGHVLGLLDRIEEDYAVDRRRSVVLGFSQGGYLAGFMALRQPHRFGGLVIASSRLKHEFLEDELASGQLPATLFLHSEKDKAVAWDRTLEGKELLEKAGAPVHYYLHEDGHRLPPDAVVRVAEWLGVRGFDRGRKAAAEIAQAWKALERNDPAKALELVKERLSDPEEIEARLIAGAASIEMEQFKEGADYLEQLGTLSIDGDTDFVRRSHLGQAYYYLGRPQDALFAFDPLEPADPYEKASLEWWKGLCLDHLGKTVRADDH